jgi:hypothetical protein
MHLPAPDDAFHTRRVQLPTPSPRQRVEDEQVMEHVVAHGSTSDEAVTAHVVCHVVAQ